MSAGDIFSQTLVYILDTVSCANTFFLEAIDDDPSTDDELSAFEAFRDEVLPAIQDIQSGEVEYECILSRRVFPTTAPNRVFSLTGNGAISGESLPANVAMNIRHFSGIGNINQRGRWFFAGLNESRVFEGRIVEDHDEPMNDFITVVTSPILPPSHEYRMKHFSKKLEQFFDIDSGASSPIPTKVRNRTPGICSIS